jgi:DNA-binding PadR family transcriptional regulator
VTTGTTHAVLGLLSERPSYGHELLARLRRAFELAQWSITPQGLYAALDRLERDGLIEPVTGKAFAGSRRQPKTPYRVTSGGERELERFLAEPIGADPTRVDLLVRLRLLAPRQLAVAVRMLDDYEQACRGELARIGGTAREAVLLDRLALAERRLAIQARLLWIDVARDELHAPSGRRRPRLEAVAG